MLPPEIIVKIAQFLLHDGDEPTANKLLYMTNKPSQDLLIYAKQLVRPWVAKIKPVDNEIFISIPNAQNVIIDWGDEISTTTKRKNLINSEYTIKIYADKLESVRFESGYITDLLTIGNSTSTQYLFANNINYNKPLRINTKNVTDMSDMFYNASSFNPVSGTESLRLNTENVTNMSGMFHYASSFNQPIQFNTQNVTNMSSMFSHASSFNQPIHFNTENVTNMSRMFYYAFNFNQPIQFNTENVIYMTDMFAYTTSLGTEPINITINPNAYIDQMFTNSKGRLK